MKQNSRLSMLLFGAMLNASAICEAAEYTWLSASPNPGNWTQNGNWSLADFPGTLADTARTANYGATTARTITLDQNITVGRLGVGWSDATGTNSAIVNLAAGGQSRILTVGSSSSAGTTFVGGSSAPAGWLGTKTGVLNLGENITYSHVGGPSFGSGGFYIGTTINTPNGGVATTGSVAVASGATLNIGTSDSRSYWGIGILNSVSGTASGTVNGSGALNAYVTDLEIGQGRQATPNPTQASATATVNLSGFSAASINADNLRLGTTVESQGAQGTLTLGSASSLTVNDQVRIGHTPDTVSTSSNQLTSTVTGQLSMVEGSSVTIGSESRRAEMVLGRNGTARVGSGGTVTREGTIAATGGAFTGYLSSLTLGAQYATAASRTYEAKGVLDLRHADIAVFDVAGDVLIGYSGPTGGEGSIGELRLSETDALIGGNLVVGDDKLGEDSQLASSGLLDLERTHLSIDGDVAVNLTGQINVLVDGESAGLWLSADSDLSILSLSGYSITFEAPADNEIYYGFGWQGNRLTELNDLVTDGYISWVDNQSIGISTFYDAATNATYIGVVAVPEPQTAILLTASLLALLWRSRRKKREAVAAKMAGGGI